MANFDDIKNTNAPNNLSATTHRSTDDEYQRLKAEYMQAMSRYVKGNVVTFNEISSLVSTLKQFCLADGRDLGELDGFFRNVDLEFTSYLPI